MINIACFHISYFSIKPPPYNRFFNIVTILSCICLVFFKRIVFPERLCTLGWRNLQRPGGAAAGGLRPPARSRSPGCGPVFGGAVGPAKNAAAAPRGLSGRAGRGRRRLAALGLPPQGRQTEGPRPGAWGLQGAERPAAAPPGRLGACRRKKGRRAGKFAGSGGSHGPGPPGIERAFFLFIIYA